MNLFADVVSDGLFDNLRADGLLTLVAGGSVSILVFEIVVVAFIAAAIFFATLAKPGSKIRSAFKKSLTGLGIALVLIVSFLALPPLGLLCAKNGHWVGAILLCAPGFWIVFEALTYIRAQEQYIKALEGLALASEQLLEQTRELARESGSSAEPGIDAPSTPVGSAFDVPVVKRDIPSNIDLFERALDESNDFDSLRYRTARANLDKMQKMRRERFERKFAENDGFKERFPDQLRAVQAMELADVANDRRRNLRYSPIEVCVISSDDALVEGLRKYAAYFKRRAKAELTFGLPFEDAELIKTKLVGTPVSVFIVKR